jgi:hypothetical protein
MIHYQVVRHYVVRVPHRVLVLVSLILQKVTQVIQTMESHEFNTIIVLLMQKSLTHFITYCCIGYTSSLAGFELTT